MNRSLACLAFVVILLLNVLVLVPDHRVRAGDGWVIDGDKVYVNNSKFYASAVPHILSGSGWVVFEFESKTYDGDIDMVWGFNTDNTLPNRNIQIWRNYTHYYIAYRYEDRTGSKTFYNVTSYENLGIENYDFYNVTFGNKNNTKLYSFTYNNGNNSAIVAFTSFQEVGDGDDYRATGVYSRWLSYSYNRSFFDWDDIDLSYVKYNWDHGGMDTWYLVKNQNIQKDKRYKIRAWIDVEFKGFDTVSGKYWWGFKPSSESLQQAKDNGHLYVLDPWYNTAWNYRKKLTIDSGQVYATDVYRVWVNITSDSDLANDAQDDFDDILFTSSDGNTKLEHEIERYDSNTGLLNAWVNMTVDSGTDTDFYMYYNNSGCGNQEDVSGCFPSSDFVAVWHMDDASGGIDDSTSNYDGSESGTPDYEQLSGMGGYGINIVRSSEYFTFSDTGYFDGDNDFTIMAFGHIDVIDSQNWMVQTRDESYTGIRFYHGGARSIQFITTDAGGQDNLGTLTYNAGQWYHLVASYDADVGKKLWIDYKNYYSNANFGTFTGQAESNWVGSGDSNVNGFDGTISEMWLVKEAFTAGMSHTYYNNWVNYTAGSGFIKTIGTEESKPVSTVITIEGFIPSNNSIDNGICNKTVYALVYNNNGLRMDYNITLFDNHSLFNFNKVGTANNNTYIFLNFSDCLIYGWNYTIWFNVTEDNVNYTNATIHFRTVESVVSSGGGGSSNSRDTIGIVGIIGVLGLIGSLLFKRRKNI